MPRTLLRSLLLAAVAGSSAIAADPAADATEAPPAPAACVDFYGHVNHDWLLAETAEPPLFAVLEATSRERQLQLLERLVAAPGDDPVKAALATFWRAASDDEAIESAGLEPLRPLLDQLAKVRNSRELAEFIAETHVQGVPLLFRFDVGADLEEPRRSIAYLRQGGLALPDRDYYLRRDPATGALMLHYRAYVARLLRLGGSGATQVDAEVEAILDMETRLARASLSLVQLRDPNNSWRRVTLADIDKRFARIDFDRFLRSQGVRGLRTLSLAHDAFFVEADSLLDTLPLSSWRAYLRFHLLHALAPHLPADYRDAHQQLFGVQIAGIEAAGDQRTRALAATDLALGELLSRAYREAWLAAADATAVESLARGLIERLDTMAGEASWLSEAAREQARSKLADIRIVVGAEPDAPELDGLELGSQALAGQVMAAARWQQRRALARIGEASHPQPLRGHRVGAWYDPMHNRLAVSAALLAPPLITDDQDIAARHGGLGALLAHELSHAVGVQGAKIDAQGAIRAWWSAEDFQAFAARSQSLVAQYNGYEGLPGVPLDGRQSFLENVADLAGLEIALAALAAAGGDTEVDSAGFFRAWATVWRARTGTRELRLQLATGVHAPPRWRVNGPLANLDAFAETFECSPEQGLVRPAGERVRIWR